jgi:hypothetical protein
MGVLNLATELAGLSVKQLVKKGYPEEVAQKIASGDLPMDPSSIAARQEQMGMLDERLYRGHSDDQISSDADWWASSSPHVSETYQKNLQSMFREYLDDDMYDYRSVLTELNEPTQDQIKGLLTDYDHLYPLAENKDFINASSDYAYSTKPYMEMETLESAEADKALSSVLEEANLMGAELTPIRTNASNLAEVNAKGKNWRTVETNSNKLKGLQNAESSRGVHKGTDQIAEAVKDSEAYDGVVFKNIDDQALDIPKEQRGDTYNILASRPDVKIRHADLAAYDPEYTGGNIMGGLLAGGVGLGALSQSDEADAGFVTRGGKEILEAIHSSKADFDKFDIGSVSTEPGRAGLQGPGLYFADELQDQYGNIVYKAEIDSPSSSLLDWEKPLSEQQHLGLGDGQQTGQEFYNSYVDSMADDIGLEGLASTSEEAREQAISSFRDFMLDEGILGTQYGIDGSNRGYSIFDDSIINIVDKTKPAGLLAGAAGVGALGQSDDADAGPLKLVSGLTPDLAARQLKNRLNKERQKGISPGNTATDFIHRNTNYDNGFLSTIKKSGEEYGGPSYSSGVREFAQELYQGTEDQAVRSAISDWATPRLQRGAAGSGAGLLAAGANAEEQPRSAAEAGFAPWPEYKDPNAPLPVPTGWDILDSVTGVLGMPMAGLQGIARGVYGLATGEDLTTAGAEAAHMMGAEWKNGGNVMTPGWDTGEGWSRYGDLTEKTLKDAGIPKPVAKGLGLLNEWAPQLLFPF